MNRFPPVSTWTSQDVKPKDVSNQFTQILQQLNTLDQNQFAGAINVKDFGARGDNVNDDTNSIQTAINTASDGAVIFPPGIYKISATLTLKPGSVLKGFYTSGNATGTFISQTASVPIITLANSSSTTFEQQRSGIYGFNLSGGTDGIYAENGAVGVTVRDVMIQGFSAKGIHFRGFNQEWFCEDLEISGGVQGLFLNEKGVQADHSTQGTPILFDKNHFYSLYCHGQTQNGVEIVIPTGTGTTNTFTDLRLVTIAQDGFVWQGALVGLQILSANTESVGSSSPTFAQTTATTVAGNASVSIAAASNFVNGQVVTIAGAGANGTDWLPTISSGGGTTTLVMTTTAPTAVTSADIVNSLFSDFVIGGAGISGQNTATIQNLISVGGNIRYAIDCGGASGVAVINCKTSRPVYDPTSAVTALGYVFTTFRPVTDPVGSTIPASGSNVTPGASGAFFDICSFTLTVGTWVIHANADYTLGTATGYLSTDLGIGTAAGNSGAGLSFGDSAVENGPPAANYDVGPCVSGVLKVVVAPTPYYLKGRSFYTTLGSAKAAGRMTAIKIAN